LPHAATVTVEDGTCCTFLQHPEIVQFREACTTQNGTWAQP